MLQILTIVLPVFGLIGLGFAAVKSGYVAAETGKYLAEFAVKLAMPVFLFRTMLGVEELPAAPFALIATYFGAGAIVWLVAALITAAVLRRPQTDGAAIAMGATFSNGVLLGFPLSLSAFGPEAAAPAAMIIALDTPLLWIAATLHIESFRTERSGSLIRAVAQIVFDLIRNPIIFGIIAGVAARYMGLTLPPLIDKGLGLLGQAAVPAMLTALGMSIATYKMAGQAPTLTTICLLKVALYPALAFVLGAHVFDLPPLWTAVAVLFAAMPVGANAYLFAARYDVAVGSVSTSIALTTAAAVITASALLYVLKDLVLRAG